MACALFQGVSGEFRRAWRDWGRLKGPGGAWTMTGITDAAGVKTLTREASPAIPAPDPACRRTLAGTACEAEAAAARERAGDETRVDAGVVRVRAGVAARAGDATDGSGAFADRRTSCCSRPQRYRGRARRRWRGTCLATAPGRGGRGRAGAGNPRTVRARTLSDGNPPTRRAGRAGRACGRPIATVRHLGDRSLPLQSFRQPVEVRACGQRGREHLHGEAPLTALSVDVDIGLSFGVASVQYHAARLQERRSEQRGGDK